MPVLRITPRARRGLTRCGQFLEERDAGAASRAALEIKQRLSMLGSHPAIGRPAKNAPSMRELSIPFGGSGYVALYRHDPDKDEVVILAFRHMKEAGY